MVRDPKKFISIVVTLATLAVGVVFAVLLYAEYHEDPWTRDAHVRANIIEIAPRVEGPIVALPVTDNQKVQRGQLLFQIDPTDYENAVAIAQATLRQRKAELVNAQEAYERRVRLSKGNVISKEEYDAATATFQTAQAAYFGAEQALARAQLDLSYTKVYAPANGYLSGVTFGVGTYVQTGKPLFVLVDSDSFWVTGYFKETVLRSLQVGRPVSIRFAPRPLEVYHGTIESLGWVIFDQDAQHSELIPEVNPTVDWVRLTQRYPIRIRIDDEAKKLPLKVGVTATVQVLPMPKPAAITRAR
jgi:RND family efflux transporter MFP subunit